MCGFNNDLSQYRQKSFNIHNHESTGFKDFSAMVKEDRSEFSKKNLGKIEDKINDLLCEKKYKKRKLDNEESRKLSVSAADDFRGPLNAVAEDNSEKHHKEGNPEDEDINWMKGIKGRSSKGTF